ncbi:MAG: preprotein translocase subunit YajC [Acidimicrobiales bacterium]
MPIAAILAATKSTSGGGSNFLLFLVPLLIIGYLLLYRPQRQKAQKAQQQAKNVNVGDEVVTVGGIVGRVTSMEADRVWLELDSGVIVEFLRQAISRRLESPAAGAAGADPDEDEETEPEDREAEPAFGEAGGAYGLASNGHGDLGADHEESDGEADNEPGSGLHPGAAGLAPASPGDEEHAQETGRGAPAPDEQPDDRLAEDARKGGEGEEGPSTARGRGSGR